MTSSNKIDENLEVIRITLENFIPFLENKFNEKYEFSLESLKQRFVGIYTLLKLIFEKVIEIHDVLSDDSSEGNVFSTYKPLLDNMIRLLDIMMKEFPECLDLEFVEFFFLSVQERIQIFLSHFHQIFHINHADPQIISKISKKFFRKKILAIKKIKKKPLIFFINIINTNFIILQR